MKVLGIISARGGSKGIPGKNLRPLAGQPLLTHMIRAAQRARKIDRLILTTEDSAIAEVGRRCGIEVPFTRPTELANDHATGIDVARHSLRAMDELGYRADVQVHLFPTCPFVPAETIDALIDLVLGGCDSAMALRRVEHAHPYRLQVFNAEGLVEPLFKTIGGE